jgi:hypothetical protein
MPSDAPCPLSTAGRFSLIVMSCPERASTIEVHWYSVNPCSSRGKGGRTLMTTYGM